MDKIERIRILLKEIGLPEKQQADICVLTILGMADMKRLQDGIMLPMNGLEYMT